MRNKILAGLFLVICLVFGIYIGVNQVFASKGLGNIQSYITKIKTSPKKETIPQEEPTPISGETLKSGETVKEENEPDSDDEKSSIPEIRAIYVTGWSIGTKNVRDSIIKNMKENNFNAIVIDIKDESGQLSYDSAVQTAIDIEASQNMVSNMKNVIEELHQNDFYVIGRIVTFKDPILASSPKTVVAFRQEDGYVWKDYSQNQWPNPYNKNSWEYPLALAKEATTLGFDEIQFDYVRFPLSEGKISDIVYGFESTTKSKSDIICDFLTEAMRQIKPLGVNVSATVSGTVTKKEGDFENIGQDFTRIANIVDVICPTFYPSDYASYEYKIEKPDLSPYEIVYNSSKDALQRLANYSGNKAEKIRPYLQDFNATWLGAGNFINYTTTEVTKEIKALLDNQITSFTLWDSSNKYCYDALKEATKK